MCYTESNAISVQMIETYSSSYYSFLYHLLCAGSGSPPAVAREFLVRRQNQRVIMNRYPIGQLINM